MAGNSYIKSVEEYFLDHARKGIMLSSVDYELINKWKTRGISLETVLSAIRDVFEKHQNNDFKPIRNLNSVSDLIEAIFNKNIIKDNKITQSECTSDQELKLLFDKINYNIKKSNNERLINCLLEYKNKIIIDKDRIKNDINRNLYNLEQQFMGNIFDLLNDDEKKNINNQIEALLKDYRNKMTKTAYNKSSQSHRNNILKKMFNITFMD